MLSYDGYDDEGYIATGVTKELIIGISKLTVEDEDDIILTTTKTANQTINIGYVDNFSIPEVPYITYHRYNVLVTVTNNDYTPISIDGRR